MTAQFKLDPAATYDVRAADQRNPVWRIQNRRVYAYLEHDPRRDWSGDIGILGSGLCDPSGGSHESSRRCFHQLRRNPPSPSLKATLT